MTQPYSLHVGDCLEVIKKLDDCSIQTCITSPPYWGLRDYGVDGQLGLEKTPEEYVAKMVEVFREVRRVLRDDGTLWLNLGDSYWGGKGSNGSSKARRTAGERGYTQSGGTLLIDTRPTDGNHDIIKPKDLVGIPWRVAFALQADGWYLRQDIIWHKPNPMPESVTDRCTKSHEYIFLLSKSERYYFDQEAIKEPLAQESIGRKNRKQNLINRTGVGTLGKQIAEEIDAKHGYAGLALARNGKTGYSDDGLRNKRSVWTVSTRPFKEAHFATFPPQLIEPCVKAGSKQGDTILDPFNGAGTTGLVACRQNRNYIGIELNPEYAEIAQKRIENELNKAPLFTNA